MGASKFWMEVAVLPVIIFVGFSGNFLIVVVMNVTVLRRRTYALYLTAIAVSDTVVLCAHFLYWVNFLSLKFGRRLVIVITTDVQCIVMNSLPTVSQHVSAWFMVVIASERFVSVAFPFFARRFLRLKFAGIITVSLVLICLLAALNNRQLYHDNGACYFNAKRLKRAAQFFSFTVVYLPAGSIMILNALIVVILVRQSRSVSGGSHDEKGERKVNRVTVMMLTLTFSFLGLSLPHWLIQVIAPRGTMTDSVQAAYEILSLMYVTNYSINFFLYLLSGGEVRQEIYKLFIVSR
ncbi:uncharacterized protein LOC141913356 [Tubulanus polymorphus]|uniref:uncharacterized protein LOC141913356 n=1 Tax=Tubulanus polymorphus TaxID=672921 RepID=UPI003DA30AB4